jgi:hypothetical protein
MMTKGSMVRAAMVVLASVSAMAIAAGCDDGDDGGEATATSALPTVGTIEAAPTAPPSPVGTGVVPGPPDRVELAADPQALVCDGEQASIVTASVFDEDGVPVADGINVRFSVVALGTADPIDTVTAGGVAQTSVVAVGSQVGVVVNVSVGEVETAIRVDCL